MNNVRVRKDWKSFTSFMSRNHCTITESYHFALISNRVSMPFAEVFQTLVRDV